LENAGEGVVLTNSKGSVTYANPAFLDVTGYSSKDVEGKDFSEVLKAFTLKGEKIKPADISDAAAVTAKKQEMKIFVESKDGKKVGALINAAPVYSEKEFVGVVRVVHDMTEEIQLQQQKDDFFSIASHELRTPLSVIAGNLDTIIAGYGKSDITKEDMQLLSDSMVAADRLTKMVSDFLNVSRLDQGRLKYEIKPTNLCYVMEAVVREMKSLTDRKGIKLSYECSVEKDQKDVLADEGLLKEMLINMIGNSLKFTDTGEIVVRHGLKDGMSYVSVTDTGIGIAKDKQKLLFQRFQQAMDRTLSRQAGGTGLGLYISREFARVMGGDLVLEKSELGKGSTFSFTLPLASGTGESVKE
jgi:PAS domain S-box-containing protein